jgi:hypothetical protein
MALIFRCLLAMLAGLLAVFQYTTMTKLQPLAASISYLGIGSYWRAIRERVALDPVDGLLLALIVLLCGAIASLEFTGAHLSHFLRATFTSRRSTVLLLLACSLVFVRYYLSPGTFNWAADSSQHIAYADITARAMAQGELPFWTYYLGTGSPYLQFYGFIFFWLVGLLSLIAGDTYLSLKLVLAGCHILSGLGAYAAARAGGCRRGPAFVAGIGFVLCFWHAQHVLIMGRLQLSIVYALLPWPIWGVERALSCHTARRGLPAALFGGVLLGVLILAHPAYGYWACAFTALYSLARLLADTSRTWSKACWSRAWLPAAALGAGLAVGAALVLPMWLEKGHTGLSDGNYSLVGIPDPSWWHVLVWSNFRFWLWAPSLAEYNWYGGYLGLTLIGLSAVGLIAGVRHRRARRSSGAIAAAICLLGGFIMVFGYRTTLVHLLPNSGILAAGRYLLFVAFFLSLCAGHGVRFLQLWVRGMRQPKSDAWQRVAGLTTLLVVADLGPTTFQQAFVDSTSEVDTAGVSVRFHEGFLRRAEVHERRAQLPNYRAIWAHSDMHRFVATGLLYFRTHMPIPDGPHPGELQAVFRFVRPFERLLDAAIAQSLRDTHEQLYVDPLMYAGLSLLNVRFLLSRTATGQALGLEIPDPSPIHVASRLARAPPPSESALSRLLHLDLDRLLSTSDPRDVAGMARVLSLLEGMEVDAQTRTCRTFFVDDLPTPIDLGVDPGVTLLEHTVAAQRVDLRVHTASRCYARLAYGYFPYVEVRVDGARVQPQVTSAGFMLIELAGGEHDITLQPRLSLLRATLLWVSLALVICATVFLLYRRRSHNP